MNYQNMRYSFQSISCVVALWCLSSSHALEDDDVCRGNDPRVCAGKRLTSRSYLQVWSTPDSVCPCAQEQLQVQRLALFEEAAANSVDSASPDHSWKWSNCEPFCADNGCPCLKPWADRCQIKSCSACQECAAMVSTNLSAAAHAGDTIIQTLSHHGFAIGDLIIISAGATSESNTIAGFGSITLKNPLENSYPAGAVITKAILTPSPLSPSPDPGSPTPTPPTQAPPTQLRPTPSPPIPTQAPPTAAPPTLSPPTRGPATPAPPTQAPATLSPPTPMPQLTTLPPLVPTNQPSIMPTQTIEICGVGTWHDVENQRLEKSLNVAHIVFQEGLSSPIFPHQSVPDFLPDDNDCSTANTLQPSDDAATLKQKVKNVPENGTIFVGKGVYTDIERLNVRDGKKVKGCGVGDDRPIFSASSSATFVMWEYSREFHSDLSFVNIHFQNIGLTFGEYKDDSKAVKHIELLNLKFSDGKPFLYAGGEEHEGEYDKKGGNDRYITLTSSGCNERGCSLVKGCDVRRTVGHQGRGYGDLDSEGVLWQDNTCGGDDPSLEGHFTTCLNMKGNNGRAVRNTFRRFVDVNSLEQDHGLYAKVATNAVIAANLIAGWQTGPAGGAVKVDSCVDVEIKDNLFVTSGIQVYDNQDTTKQLSIRGNMIFVNVSNFATYPEDKGECEVCRGIGFYFNRDESGTSTRIEGNVIQGIGNGITFPKNDVSFINVDSGGLFENQVCSITRAEGVDATPPAEEQQGFNCLGDFIPTLATLAEAKKACTDPSSWFSGVCIGLAPHENSFRLMASSTLVPSEGADMHVFRQCDCGNNGNEFNCTGDIAWCDDKRQSCTGL